jgi:uncharacterized membrane protein
MYIFFIIIFIRFFYFLNEKNKKTSNISKQMNCALDRRGSEGSFFYKKRD